MDLSVKALTFVVVLFTVMFLLFDINRSSTVKQIEFETARSANQGTLESALSDYKNYQTLTSSSMFENWLVNFMNTHDVDLKEVRLKFAKISSDPPMFLVMVEGYDDEVAILNNDVYTEYISGSMIIAGE